MNVEEIVDKLLNETGFTHTERIGSISVYDLYTAVIVGKSMLGASSILGLPDSMLEHIMQRKLRPLFPDKPFKVKWNIFLLGLVGLRECTKCTNIKEEACFSKNIEVHKGIKSLCYTCDNAASKIYQDAHRQECRERSSKNYYSNKEQYRARTIKYKTKRTLATPPWASLDKLKEVYANCPEGMHVDHIIPLQGKLVSGLHVETNLQYLTAEENIKKSNKFTPG